MTVGAGISPAREPPGSSQTILPVETFTPPQRIFDCVYYNIMPAYCQVFFEFSQISLFQTAAKGVYIFEKSPRIRFMQELCNLSKNLRQLREGYGYTQTAVA